MSMGYIYECKQKKKLFIVWSLKGDRLNKWMDEKKSLKFCLFIIKLGIDKNYFQEPKEDFYLQKYL
jgi:hypothetical protein